jgi:hypothetical protein
MAWCFHKSEEVEEGFGSKALCKGCYDSVAKRWNAEQESNEG